MGKTDKKKKKELTSEELYILKAAKLKGLAAVEIEGLKRHFTGEAPNEYVVRRNPDLFELLNKKKKSKDGLIRDDDGTVVRLDNVIVSTINDDAGNKISKIITPSLTSYISKPVATSIDESSKFYDLAIKNELFLPYVAIMLGVDAATFEEAVIKTESGNTVDRHLTRTFVREDEVFVTGNQILNKDKVKDKDKSRKPSKKVGMNFLLDKVEKYIKKFGKKEDLNDEEIKALKKEIRQGIIKQTFVNKLMLNDNESNYDWGLIKKGNSLRLAPLLRFEQSAGVITKDELPTRRVVFNTGKFGGREDIQSFMLYFGREDWFKEWTKGIINDFDIDKAFGLAEEKSNFSLSEKEKDYYRAVFGKTVSLAKEVIDLDFDESKFGKLSLFKNRPKRIKQIIDKDDNIRF